jgi:hypothetical protein
MYFEMNFVRVAFLSILTFDADGETFLTNDDSLTCIKYITLDSLEAQKKRG